MIEESTKNIVNIEEVYSGESSGGTFSNNNYINNQIQIIESDEVISTILLTMKKLKLKLKRCIKSYQKIFYLKMENFLIF